MSPFVSLHIRTGCVTVVFRCCLAIESLNLTIDSILALLSDLTNTWMEVIMNATALGC